MLTLHKSIGILIIFCCKADLFPLSHGCDVSVTIIV